jgi:hypothetical protein
MRTNSLLVGRRNKIVVLACYALLLHVGLPLDLMFFVVQDHISPGSYQLNIYSAISCIVQ